MTVQRRTYLSCGAIAGLLGTLLFAGAADAAPEGLTWTATVDGRNVETSTRADPVRLTPGEPVTVAVRLENRGAQPVRARWVRMEGLVLGLSFYVYTTRVDMEAPAGGSDERVFDVDLLDLDRQASGLIPSQVALLDERGQVVAAKTTLVDVRGSAFSVYGIFGLAVAAITALLLGAALWRLSSGRLPRNRWRRGIIMAAPGLGIGFILTFTLSVLRWASPSAALWTTLLLVGAVAGFLAGYLSPTPGRDDEAPTAADEVADDDVFAPVDDEVIAAGVVPSWSGPERTPRQS